MWPIACLATAPHFSGDAMLNRTLRSSTARSAAKSGEKIAASWNSSSGPPLGELCSWRCGILVSDYQTRELSAAQLAAHSAVDPWRARVAALPDDMSFSSRVRAGRLAR